MKITINSQKEKGIKKNEQSSNNVVGFQKVFKFL
jgi:hypothetical protein